jgi:hypothetical protein
MESVIVERELESEIGHLWAQFSWRDDRNDRHWCDVATTDPALFNTRWVGKYLAEGSGSLCWSSYHTFGISLEDARRIAHVVTMALDAFTSDEGNWASVQLDRQKAMGRAMGRAVETEGKRLLEFSETIRQHVRALGGEVDW